MPTTMMLSSPMVSTTMLALASGNCFTGVVVASRSPEGR